MSKYTEISITDGVTTKKKLFTDIATDELSVNEIVNLSGTVTVNGNCLNIEPFDEGDAFGLITRLKDEAVKQYLAGARS